MSEFRLPDLGEGLSEAEIVAWHVQVGDTVTVDQNVVEVETAKAVVDVPIPYAGVVSTLHARAGEVVAVGAPLITVAVAGDAGAPAASPAGAGFREPGIVTGPAGTGSAEAPAATGSGSDVDGTSGNVLVGYGTPAAAPRRFRRRSAPVAGAGRPAATGPEEPAGAAPDRLAATGPGQPAGAAPDQATRNGTGPAPANGTRYVAPPRQAEPVRPAGPVPVISPLVRRLARDGGLDLATVRGSGPGGLVRRWDVEQALAARDAASRSDPGAAATAATASTAPTGPTVPTGPTASTGTAAGRPVAGGGGREADERRIPIRGLRKVMADKLSRSRREIPEATVWVDVDATDLLAARAQLNARDPQHPVSVLALIARFTLLALRRYPELNGRIAGDELVVPSAVHLGFAAQTDRGLVVPVVHDAHRMTTRELAAAIAGRTTAARSGALGLEALTGGTFTVNNYGVFGVDGSAAIINHPEVAILGVGRIIDRPWVVDGALAVRKVTELTLAFDHRACDGGTAGGFLRLIADCVESPIAALADL